MCLEEWSRPNEQAAWAEECGDGSCGSVRLRDVLEDLVAEDDVKRMPGLGQVRPQADEVAHEPPIGAVQSGPARTEGDGPRLVACRVVHDVDLTIPLEAARHATVCAHRRGELGCIALHRIPKELDEGDSRDAIRRPLDRIELSAVDDMLAENALQRRIRERPARQRELGRTTKGRERQLPLPE